MATDHRELLWDPVAPRPAPETIPCVTGAFDVIVHRAGEDGFAFLHDCTIAEHQGTLFAAWYNCPQAEMQGSALIRGRRSRDGGRTWSAAEVIAQDREGRGVMYVPAVLLSHAGTLHAFVATMVGPDLVTGCESFMLDEAADRWVGCGPMAGPFLPNGTPRRMADGCFLLPGRMAHRPGEKPLLPAVAISRGDELTAPWQVIPLLPSPMLPDGGTLRYPETTAFVDGLAITALVRRDGGNSLLFTSPDGGRTWSGPCEHNFPTGAAKMCAGTLSTGQRYLLSNTTTAGYRELLTIAVGRPGAKALCRLWAVRHGYAEALQAGPEWSYPAAVEADGRLFVVYTSQKRHCVLTALPVEALAI